MFQNHYFSWKRLWKFIGIIGWVSLYILAPILVGGVWFFGLGLLGIAYENQKLLIGILGLAGILGFGFWFVYLAIRLTFANFILLESIDLKKSAHAFTKEGLAVTKGKFWQIIGLAIPFVVTIFLLSQIMYNLEQNLGFSLLFQAITFFGLEGISFMIYLSIYHIIKIDQ